MRTASPRIGLYQPYPHTFGGVQSMVIKLAKSLPNQGYAPIVISPEHGSFTQTLESQQLDYFVSDPGAPWHVYGRGNKGLSYLLSPRRLISLVRYWFNLCRDLKENRIELLHCNDYRAVMLAAPAARLAGIPVIWHMHGFIHSPIANLIASSLVKWTVPVSAGMLNYLSLPRWAFGNYSVINNGTELTPPPSPSTSQRSYPIVLAVGALHPRKGYETLISAFEKVSSSMPEAQCWIVGGDFADGSYGAQLREQVKSLHLENHVKFIGHSDNVPALLNQCQLLVIPSKVEAFGMVALEAMLAGKPVVASNTGGLSEIVNDSETGRLVAPGDSKAMAESIINILSNPEVAEQMGEAGQRRVRSKFSLNHMSNAFAEFYSTLLRAA